MRLDLSRRSNRELLGEFSALVENDRRSTSEMLAYIGEIGARKLYRPAGYPSMFKYCVHELHMSEDVAYKRTRVARLARRFPVLFDAIADGRLHLSGVVLLSPYEDAREFPELLEAAFHRTRAEIQLLLAERFPQSDVPTVVRAIAPRVPAPPPAPGPDSPLLDPQATGALGGPEAVGSAASLESAAPGTTSAPIPAIPMEPLAPGPVGAPAPRASLAPLAPQRFALQVTLAQATYDKLRRAQDLLGHQVPAGDLAAVLDRALDLLVRQLERAKFAATEKPRPGVRRSTEGKRHIPAGVRRAVFERDGGRCTYVSDSGHRCEERRGLHYDHVAPFARGGEANLQGIRLLCPAHNQHEAERVYGAGFMERKREEARRQVDAKSQRRAISCRSRQPR